nr:hypothetical protein PJ912_13620 [Pectobacterium colocasium]
MSMQKNITEHHLRNISTRNKTGKNNRHALPRPPVILLALTGCQALTTFDKYATMRLYEVYEAENLSACDYKPQFRDCTVDKRFF